MAAVVVAAQNVCPDRPSATAAADSAFSRKKHHASFSNPGLLYTVWLNFILLITPRPMQTKEY
jgi:hypothetical protein